MKRIVSQLGLLVVFASLSVGAYSHGGGRTIYGTSNAQRLYAKVPGPFYIQLGSFSHKSNAERLKQSLRSQVKQPIFIRKKNGYYTVIIGPIASAAEVRSLGKAAAFPHAQVRPLKVAPKPSKRPHVNTLVHAKTPQRVSSKVLDKDGPIRHGNWFVGGDIGVQKPQTMHFLVENASGLSFPYDWDKYTMNSASTTMLLGVDGGYRWKNAHSVFPAYALGIRYRHFFSGSLRGQVEQYSLSEFTNYDYSWKFSSDMILLTSKLNLFQVGLLMPYVSGGVGVAFKHGSAYRETALPNVTSRLSPAFSKNTIGSFTGSFGAGIDCLLTPKLIMSLGYEFQNLGSVQSGPGAGTWANRSLQLGAYQSNGAVLSLNYLIGE